MSFLGPPAHTQVSLERLGTPKSCAEVDLAMQRSFRLNVVLHLLALLGALGVACSAGEMANKTHVDSGAQDTGPTTVAEDGGDATSRRPDGSAPDASSTNPDGSSPDAPSTPADASAPPWTSVGYDGGGLAAAHAQVALPAVERMARVPSPLAMRDWKQVAIDYHQFVFNPSLAVDVLPQTSVDAGAWRGLQPLVGFAGDRSTFGFSAYVFASPAPSGEAMACIAPVIGATLVGLDMTNLYGYDFVAASQKWYDPGIGLYRDTPGQNDGVVHADIYGYWPVVLSLILADLYPGRGNFSTQQATTAKQFYDLAVGMGCPDHADFANLGWDFSTHQLGGRQEPMNKLGNAPSVAWISYMSSQFTKDPKYVENAKCAIAWHIAHPGRYEISHVPGPIVVARLNAEQGTTFDLTQELETWFGDCPDASCPWKITSGTSAGGLTTDGLDGAWWGGSNRDFYAFSMGSLQGPGWLVPVARYDARYARAIARYALHAANSARLLQGYGLDADHQDHKPWKDRWDPRTLLFYEGMPSYDWAGGGFRPYASGDPIKSGWGPWPAVPTTADYFRQKAQWFSEVPGNLALYMGNHVGFLGGIFAATNVDGIVQWDCLKTDYYNAPAYPTYLYYNPYTTSRAIELDVGSESRDVYDVVTGRFVARSAHGPGTIELDADSAAVLVLLPSGGAVTRDGARLLVNDVVVDYHAF
jgi:hypothetical protein